MYTVSLRSISITPSNQGACWRCYPTAITHHHSQAILVIATVTPAPITPSHRTSTHPSTTHTLWSSLRHSAIQPPNFGSSIITNVNKYVNANFLRKAIAHLRSRRCIEIYIQTGYEKMRKIVKVREKKRISKRERNRRRERAKSREKVRGQERQVRRRLERKIMLHDSYIYIYE